MIAQVSGQIGFPVFHINSKPLLARLNAPAPLTFWWIEPFNKPLPPLFKDFQSIEILKIRLFENCKFLEVPVFERQHKIHYLYVYLNWLNV